MMTHEGFQEGFQSDFQYAHHSAAISEVYELSGNAEMALLFLLHLMLS